MKVRTSISYKGDLSCEVTHEPSGNKFLTDAPKDNNGQGRWVSPTDLVGASMGSCMMTIMSMEAKKLNISLQGASVTVDKSMKVNPRRIGQLEVHFYLPDVRPEFRSQLESAALGCPVKQSLSADVEVPVTFHWGIKEDPDSRK